MKFQSTREFRSSSLSVFFSVLVHVSLICAFALIFFPNGFRQAISLESSSADEEYSSEFESPMDEDPFEAEMPEDAFEMAEPVSVEQQLDDLLDEIIDESTEPSLPVDLSFLDGQQLDAEEKPPSGSSSAEASSRGFFGIQASGDRIVFVIDNSISMGYRDRYDRRFAIATREALASIEELSDEQQFYVMCFCFKLTHMKVERRRQRFLFPTADNRTGLARWFQEVGLGSGTDPREALVAALKMEPSCVYLLSDGEFNGRQHRNGKYGRGKTAVELAREFNTNGCPIHTIGLHDKGSQEALKTIASDSGGTYKFIPQAE